MKKLLLAVSLGLILAGCSIKETHNVTEDGYINFEKVIDLTSEAKDQSEKKTKEDYDKMCNKMLDDFDKDIENKSCVSDEKGVFTLKGRYKVTSGNFENKDRYILFNVKEINVARGKMSSDHKFSGPLPGDADKSAKQGVKDEYIVNLPGIPINYNKGMKINTFMVFNDKDYFLVSKLKEGRSNSFQDKLTKENEDNINSLKYFPKVLSEKESFNNIADSLIKNAQETHTPLLTNIPNKTEENDKQEDIEHESQGKSFNSSGEMLVSTGNKSIILNVLDSIVNFFSNLF